MVLHHEGGSDMMKDKENGLNWKAILWSALLLFGIPFMINLIIGSAYGLMIGFQTRGDVSVINAKMQTFTSSPLFLGLLVLVVCLTAFWRGRVLAKKVGAQQAVSHALIAVGLGMSMRTLLALGLSSDRLGILTAWLVGEWVLAFASGFLGTRSEARK
jgi:hypothetical protein